MKNKQMSGVSSSDLALAFGLLCGFLATILFFMSSLSHGHIILTDIPSVGVVLLYPISIVSMAVSLVLCGDDERLEGSRFVTFQLHGFSIAVSFTILLAIPFLWLATSDSYLWFVFLVVAYVFATSLNIRVHWVEHWSALVQSRGERWENMKLRSQKAKMAQEKLEFDERDWMLCCLVGCYVGCILSWAIGLVGGEVYAIASVSVFSAMIVTVHKSSLASFTVLATALVAVVVFVFTILLLIGSIAPWLYIYSISAVIIAVATSVVHIVMRQK